MEIENFKNSLKKLQKCDMYWDEMKPNKNGRLCQKCDKTIIDFSNMSFTEIALKMSETNKSTCGLYLPQQLAEIKRYKNNIPLSIGFTTLIATTSLADSEKKDVGKHITFKQTQNKWKNKFNLEQDNIINDTILISGTIQYYDSLSKKNLTDSYANIFIKGTKIGVGINEDGLFKIKYLPNIENEKIQLIASAVGFEQQTIEIIFDGKKNIDLGLILLKESELISYYVTKKRNFFGRLIRKITKPFRYKKQA
jgi:CarboxypepD_reg-like domain